MCTDLICIWHGVERCGLLKSIHGDVEPLLGNLRCLCLNNPTPRGEREGPLPARAIQRRARYGSARSGTQRSCARRDSCGVRSKSRRSSASSSAATHPTDLPASIAMPAGTTACSRTLARRAISARAATRSGYCSTASGSSSTCLRPCPTGSMSSPFRGSCARCSAGTGHGLCQATSDFDPLATSGIDPRFSSTSPFLSALLRPCAQGRSDASRATGSSRPGS